MDEKMWMVRAGEGAYLIEDFKKLNIVAVGWKELGDITGKNLSKNDLINMIGEMDPGLKEAQIRMSANQFFKFMKKINIGDYVISYNPDLRQYLVGKIKSDHKYEKDICGDYSNYRKVDWKGTVNRDDISTSSKNAIGAISTLFEVRDFARKEILALLAGKPPLGEEIEDEVEDIDNLREDVINRANEFIKDNIMLLNWEEMQDLVAGILRAMGFKTRTTGKGSDRGRDVVASPDGLGLENPRIFVEVKHKNNPIGSKEIRSFIGALRPECKGVYVSTGGFTKEAFYEAERSNIPITLIDSTELVNLIIQYYDNFDNEARGLVPLTKVYWPT